MKTKIMILALLMPMSIVGAYAQVTIGSEASPRATLDVVATKTDGTTPEGIIAPRLTLTQLNAKQAQYTTEQEGAFVYITDSGGTPVAGYSNLITCTGYAYWDGAQWVMDCGMPLRILLHPQQSTFYAQGPVTTPLVCVAVSDNSPLTYRWYKIVGGAPQACSAADGTGYNMASFTPNAEEGLNRYYCVVSDGQGSPLTSNTAEVQIGE